MSGLGLGYIAQGMMAGIQGNRDWSMRKRQDQRQENADNRAAGMYGPTLRAANANANMIENNASDDNLDRTNRTNEAKAVNAEANAKRGMFLATDDMLGMQYDQTAEQVKGMGLGNDLKQQQVDLGAEAFTPQAVGLRAQEQAFRSSDLQRADQLGKLDLTVKKRNEKLAQLKHINDTTQQKQLKQKLTDIDAYETISRLRQGDKLSALKLFNDLDSNGIYDATDLSFTENGDLIIQRQSGETLTYPVSAIASIEQRVKADMAKANQPKINTEKVYEDGVQTGERYWKTVSDPKTGQTYKEYITEKPVDGKFDPYKIARDMIKVGDLTEEEYNQMHPDKPLLTMSRPVENGASLAGVEVPRPAHSKGAMTLGVPPQPKAFNGNPTGKGLGFNFFNESNR